MSVSKRYTRLCKAIQVGGLNMSGAKRGDRVKALLIGGGPSPLELLVEAVEAGLGVLEAARDQGKGVLIKKGLMSGHVQGREGVRRSFAHVFAQPGVSSMIVGTINLGHLRDNIRLLEQVLEGLA